MYLFPDETFALTSGERASPLLELGSKPFPSRLFPDCLYGLLSVCFSVILPVCVSRFDLDCLSALLPDCLPGSLVEISTTDISCVAAAWASGCIISIGVASKKLSWQMVSETSFSWKYD